MMLKAMQAIMVRHRTALDHVFNFRGWVRICFALSTSQNRSQLRYAQHIMPCSDCRQMVKLERTKAAVEADKLAFGQRLEQEWETREAAEAAVLSAAEAAARAAARDFTALQEALDKVHSGGFSKFDNSPSQFADAIELFTYLPILPHCC